MAKRILYDKVAQEKIIAGSKKLAKAVGQTMGPMGRNVVMGRYAGNPVITKDGVSVAREVVLEDHMENLACSLVKEASGRTADVAGDGTTTATVLAADIIERGFNLINMGESPLVIRDGLTAVTNEIISYLGEISSPVKDLNSLIDVASIAANNDYEIGEAIATAYDMAGWKGTVVLEARPGLETTVRKIDGVELNSGYITESFLYGNDGSKNCTLKNAKVIILDDELTHIMDSLALFNELSDKKIPVLIIANNVKQEALAMFVENNRIGRLKVCCIKTPDFKSSFRKMWLEDLAALVGGKVYSSWSGNNLSEAKVDDLGSAKRIVVSRDSTKIIEGNVDSRKVEERIRVYNDDLDKLIGDLDRLDVHRRISFLKNKASVISVGYSTELELREKGDRYEDSVAATKAAIDEGVVVGGGMALYSASKMLMSERCSVDEKYSSVVELMSKSCTAPLRKICENANQNFDVISMKINQSNNENFGYNASADTFEDLVSSGVIDPKKVTRTALENAVSIAKLLLTTSVVMDEIPENESGWQPPAGWRPPESGKMNHKY